MDYLLNASEEELFVITLARGPFRRERLVLSTRDVTERRLEYGARFERGKEPWRLWCPTE